MATVVRTSECFPKALVLGKLVLRPPEADHARCPGGQTIKGVMGGWVCPCECHRRVTTDEGGQG